MIDYRLLINEAEKLGIMIDTAAAQRFDAYAQRLVEVNEHMNLTAITEPEDIVIKHFIDCIYVMKYVSFKQSETLVDIGTGAGFPAIPLLIANPTLNVTLVDSLKKRIDFLSATLDTIGLKGRCIHARAEDFGCQAAFREQFDYATARAVAPLNILCEYCLPLIKMGGRFISLKGAMGVQELKDAKNAIALLGGAVEDIKEYTLPSGDARSIIIINKLSQTSTQYPRKPKKITAAPL